MKVKKTIYIILSALLFLIISYGLHAVIEIIILNSTDSPTWYTHFGGSCALPPVISYLLPVIGIIFGIWAGFKWWQIVYVERRHWRFKNKKLNDK